MSDYSDVMVGTTRASTPPGDQPVFVVTYKDGKEACGTQGDRMHVDFRRWLSPTAWSESQAQVFESMSDED